MSNRTLTSSLRLLSRRNGPSARLAGLQSRLFSTTPSFGVKALFSETEDALLNEKLKHIQDNIILPSYLPEKQRRRVFDVKGASLLEQDPIILEVEGYEHKFATINRFTSIENSKRIFMKVLALMRDADDWKNLGSLLAGYQKAGIKLRADHWGSLVRAAGESGAIYSIIECAKEADKTGLCFDSPEISSKVILCVNQKIALSAWDEAETKQALKWTEIILDLLQREEHAAPADCAVRKLHFSKANRGMTLFSRASVAKVKQDAGESIDQDIVLLKDEAVLLQSLWKDSLTEDLATVKDFSALNPSLEKVNGRVKNKPRALNGSAYVQVISQAIKGIELSQELLGEEAAGLLPIKEALDKHLVEFIEGSPSAPKGWDKGYEQIVGRSPAWAGRCREAEEEAAEAKAAAAAKKAAA